MFGTFDFGVYPSIRENSCLVTEQFKENVVMGHAGCCGSCCCCFGTE